MLNDFSISRDVINLVEAYLTSKNIVDQKVKDTVDRLSLKQQLSYEQWWGLLDKLAQETGDKTLGLSIGRDANPEQCGVLGYLFKTSRTLLDALNSYRRFERLLYAGSKVESVIKDGTLTFVWDPKYGYSSQLSDELLLAAMVSVMRAIMAPNEINPTEICFTQDFDKDISNRYERFFKSRINTADKLSISFRLADLGREIPHQDSALNRLLDQQAQEKLSSLPEQDTFIAELQNAILQGLHEGTSSSMDAANKLHISTRTLHRKLLAKQKQYKDVLKEVRRATAITYLNDEQLSLSEISLLLAYTDQSAFTRAFKTWTGLTPRQFKTQTKKAPQ